MKSERGVALLVTLLATTLLSAVGAALIVLTTTDVLIASNAGAAAEAFHAANAAFERTVGELRTAPDLTAVLDGRFASAFTDGGPNGSRLLPDGSTISLSEVVNRADCLRPTACQPADLDAALPDRPWGARNPRWKLFSYGPLDGLSGFGARGAAVFVVSMIADDPLDDDGDAWRDGVRLGATPNAGAGVLLVRAEAFGRRGTWRVVEGAILRLDAQRFAVWEASDPLSRGPAPLWFPQLQLLSWREVR